MTSTRKILTREKGGKGEGGENEKKNGKKEVRGRNEKVRVKGGRKRQKRE